MNAELGGSSISAGVVADHGIGAERIEWLVDNADAYREMLQAIGRARRSVWITQLAFDADCRVYETGSPSDVARCGGSFLLETLLEASRARCGRVRILLNESLLLDTAGPLREALRMAVATDIRVRGIKHFPQLLHAKMLIVDEREALLVGSPFVNDYWDDACHRPIDIRRPERELGGRPLHDLSVRITGPAVLTLGAIFAELWNDVSVGSPEDAPIECRPASARDDSAGIRIAPTRRSSSGSMRRATPT